MNTSSLLAAVMLASVVMPTAASAQSVPIPPEARVAYVSSQRVSVETTAGKAGTSRMQALQAERTAQVRARQQAWEATRQQLAAAATAEERSRLGLQESTQRADYERSVAQSQLDLQNLQREISAELRVKIVAALNEVLKGTKIEIVMNMEAAVIWSAPGLDITSALIAKMDAAGRP